VGALQLRSLLKVNIKQDAVIYFEKVKVKFTLEQSMKAQTGAEV
jgi:hypothetical protein